MSSGSKIASDDGGHGEPQQRGLDWGCIILWLPLLALMAVQLYFMLYIPIRVSSDPLHRYETYELVLSVLFWLTFIGAIAGLIREVRRR